MSRIRTSSCPLSWLCPQVPKGLTAQPAEPASVGGRHCHFDQMVPVIANLKPKIRVEKDKGATGPHGYPAPCRPHRRSHPATVELQRQGGRGGERCLAHIRAKTREQKQGAAMFRELGLGPRRATSGGSRSGSVARSIGVGVRSGLVVWGPGGRQTHAPRSCGL